MGNRLVCAPSSTWCDPLVSNQAQLQRLFEEVRRLALRRSSTRIEVRCRRKHLHRPEGWAARTRWKHHTISLNQEPEALWNGLSLNSVRQMARRARTNGVSIGAANSETAMRLFYSALVETRRTLGLPMLTYRYFSSLQETLSQEVRTIFVALLSGRVLGAALTLTRHGMCHLELTGEYPESRRIGAMQLLICTAVERARRQGCGEFSFGRTGLMNVGLLRYKRRWNTCEEDLATLTWERGEGATSFLSRSLVEAMSRSVMRLTPRSAYRLLGSLIYRHWA